MKSIEKLKNALWRYKMRDIASKQQRNRKMMGFDQAKYVGVYIPYTPENYAYAKRFVDFLKTKGIKVMVLAYVDAKELPADLTNTTTFSFFAKNRLKFNHTTKDDHALKFINQAFDILIDLSITPGFQDLYISNASKASFKIGKVSEWGMKVYDFTIDVPESTNTEGLLEAILNYLKIFDGGTTEF